MKLKTTKAILFVALSGIICLSSCKKSLENKPASPSIKRNLATAGSPVGDVVGKVTVGYQGWFAAIGDGSILICGGIGQTQTMWLPIPTT